MGIKVYNVGLDSIRFRKVSSGETKWASLLEVQPYSITYFNPIRVLHVVDDSLLCVGGSNNGVFDIIDINSWTKIGGSDNTFTTTISGTVKYVANSDDYIIFATSTERVYVVDRQTMDIVNVRAISSFDFYSIDIDSDFIYVGHSTSGSQSDPVFTIIDLQDFSIVLQRTMNQFDNAPYAISHTDEYLYLFIGDNQDNIRVFDRNVSNIRSGTLNEVNNSLSFQERIYKSIVEGDKIYAFENPESRISVIDNSTLTVVDTYTSVYNEYGLDFAMDSYYYYLGLNDSTNSMLIVDRETKDEVTTYNKPNNNVYAVAASSEYVFAGPNVATNTENLKIYKKQ